jgi:hypothetical protein
MQVSMQMEPEYELIVLPKAEFKAREKMPGYERVSGVCGFSISGGGSGMSTIETLEEAPAKLMPCRGKLARLFSEHKKSRADLEALRARLSRAESDEAAALDSSLMSDEEVSERIEAAQSARRVYGARVTAGSSD